MAKWDVSNFDNWKSDEFPIGMVGLEAGNSVDYLTGGWRTFRPVWDEDKCVSCLFCWVHCPDASVIVEDGEMKGIDYDHCKGCGICVNECPKGALEMVNEVEAQKGDQNA